MAQRAVDFLADQRVERRAQRQRQAVPETEVGENQADNGVDAPGVQPPVEEGGAHRLLGGGDGARVRHRRRGEVGHRLGDAEEHQADAHAGGEQHREPGPIAVVRLRVILAQLDVAEAAHRQKGHQGDDDRHGEHVEPAGVADYPRFDVVEHGFRGFRHDHRKQHHGGDDRHRSEEHRRIDQHLGFLFWGGGLLGIVAHRALLILGRNSTPGN